MSALAEFALAEIGDAELALDSRWYADIAAASSPLFTASASGGRVVYASARYVARRGRTGSSRAWSQPATADATFYASAGGQLIANIDPKQNWVRTPAADGSRALLSGGTASLSFTADAVPVGDGIFLALPVGPGRVQPSARRSPTVSERPA